ncbi:MAG: FKBP-type peptidyl-prolyl cis-trans isomerase [Bacteroidetes bacterium]|nr:FKBP-type peptidyl-prolyl cis-trans isomerase [Bacteroidota bacterium]
MKKIILNPFVVIVLIAMTSLSCSSQFSGYDKTKTGLYYKLYKVSKDTTLARTGDYISLDIRYTYKAKGKDTTLFDSKKQMGQPVKFQLMPSDFKGDLWEGIRMLSPGDSAGFIISADSLFLKTYKMAKRPPMIDSNSFIKCFVHLLAVDSPQALKNKEGETLQNYLTTNKITAQPTPSGIYIIESEQGKGMKIDSGVQVKLHFKVSQLDGKQIYSTYDHPEPMSFQYGKRFDTPGFEEAISTMKKGSKATIIVPSKMAFGEQGRGNLVPPFATLLYNVEILNVQTKAEFDKEAENKKKEDEQKKASAKKDESMLLQKYLKEHNITTKPTASGLYYIEKVKGTGPRAEAGKKLKVNYKGTLLDGKVFDQSKEKPLEFTLGQGQVIKGWDEGFTMMNKGGKATLIIPSSIAYGDRSMSIITPYSTLVFEVELLDITDAPAPKAPPKTGK